VKLPGRPDTRNWARDELPSVELDVLVRDKDAEILSLRFFRIGGGMLLGFSFLSEDEGIAEGWFLVGGQEGSRRWKKGEGVAGWNGSPIATTHPNLTHTNWALAPSKYYCPMSGFSTEQVTE
jgi:hypothetical protein